MKYGILTDIHGNLEALQVVLNFLEEKGAEVIVVPGDVVGYGANPGECLELLVKRNVLLVRGNHEEALLSGNISHLRAGARAAITWTRQRLNQDWMDFLSKWPGWLVEKDFFVCHGSPDNLLSGYVYSISAARKAFACLNYYVCFHGHTHYPCGYRQKKDGNFVEMIPADFNGKMNLRLDPDWRYLINAGSVGQPRDGLPLACAGIYDDVAMTFTLERLNYPVDQAREKILACGLPASLGNRLLRGV